MGEKITKEQRSKNMSAIRSISKLEDKISKALWNRGLRLRRNVVSLYGKPDFALKKYKVVIFIDSCFWHSCPEHGNKPKNNSEFWEKKLNRNVERDKEVTDYYINHGWNILRVWEHEFKFNFEDAITKIEKFLRNLRNKEKA
ncbi:MULTISPECIES: very short patch repair endonuclease [Planomicrobium]|uniref:very short patch repair endonuclease n=1 Tax=Planomicrobium TaxID=162291 RepID=UPI000C7A4C43|nr:MULTISPECIES: very short patch repair endonuclease [Planomicrobium]PKH10676.1 very short patch repair endonuclease [Planomicrobium sp. MB-3u-38]